MKQSVAIHTEDLDRRGLQLTIFACCAILVLAVGVAALMYAVLFSPGTAPITGTPRATFIGFCALCFLLLTYIVDRQYTIVKLRNQIAGDRKKALAAQELASSELLRTLPNFGSFQDRLPMEYRRAATSGQNLSILLVYIQLHRDFSAPSMAKTVLGDAAKAIARKLREQDSIYLLQMYYFAIVLPGVQMDPAHAVSSRIAEGLKDVAGANERLSFRIDVINYPEHASTASELESAIRGLMPDEHSRQLTSAEMAT